MAGTARQNIPVNIMKNPVQNYAVWFGGSYLGSIPGFENTCKSREEYMEHGASICRHNALM